MIVPHWAYEWLPLAQQRSPACLGLAQTQGPIPPSGVSSHATAALPKSNASNASPQECHQSPCRTGQLLSGCWSPRLSLLSN